MENKNYSPLSQTEQAESRSKQHSDYEDPEAAYKAGYEAGVASTMEYLGYSVSIVDNLTECALKLKGQAYAISTMFYALAYIDSEPSDRDALAYAGNNIAEFLESMADRLNSIADKTMAMEASNGE